MNYTLNNILFLLSLVIEKVGELMSIEKGSQRGLKLNQALMKLEEVRIILND